MFPLSLLVFLFSPPPSFSPKREGTPDFLSFSKLLNVFPYAGLVFMSRPPLPLRLNLSDPLWAVPSFWYQGALYFFSPPPPPRRDPWKTKFWESELMLEFTPLTSSSKRKKSPLSTPLTADGTFFEKNSSPLFSDGATVTSSFWSVALRLASFLFLTLRLDLLFPLQTLSAEQMSWVVFSWGTIFPPPCLLS